jgi:hypothetical protein
VAAFGVHGRRCPAGYFVHGRRSSRPPCWCPACPAEVFLTREWLPGGSEPPGERSAGSILPRLRDQISVPSWLVCQRAEAGSEPGARAAYTNVGFLASVLVTGIT